MSASSLPKCSKCGNERGPWKPSGEVLPSCEQLFVCQDGCPVAELAAAVAEHGPFPMPVGTPGSLNEILARADAATPGPWCTDAWEIYQGTEYLPGLSWWIGETCRGTSTPEQDRADATFVAAARTDVPELVAEVVRWRARTEEAEVGEAQLRGQVRGLRAHIAELEALKPARFQDCQVCGAGYEYGQPCTQCQFKKLMAEGPGALPRDLSPELARRIEQNQPETNTSHECNLPLSRRLDCGHCPHEVCQDCKRCPHTCRCASPEDPHDSPLRHRYDTPRDLPEVPR